MLGHILLLGSLGTEETMKRQWRVRREAVERPDAKDAGTKRTRPSCGGASKTSEATSKPVAPSANGKEEYHEGGGVRSGLDLRQVKLQTIEQQLEMVCRYAQEKGWELAGGGHLPRRRLQRHDA